MKRSYGGAAGAAESAQREAVNRIVERTLRLPVVRDAINTGNCHTGSLPQEFCFLAGALLVDFDSTAHLRREERIWCRDSIVDQLRKFHEVQTESIRVVIHAMNRAMLLGATGLNASAYKLWTQVRLLVA